MGYIYIIYTREFLKHQEPVYKIGRSDNVLCRMRQYPRGSKLIFAQYVHDDCLLEKHVLNHLTGHFKARTDIGSEYFEGDVQQLIAHVQTILGQHASSPLKITYEDELANRVKKPGKAHVKNTDAKMKKKTCDDEEDDEEDDDC